MMKRKVLEEQGEAVYIDERSIPSYQESDDRSI